MLVDKLAINNDIMEISQYSNILCKNDCFVCYNEIEKCFIQETVVPTDYYRSSFLPKDDFSNVLVDEIVDSAFVCLYQWCFNYQHFLTECLPKVLSFLYLKKTNNELKIIIPNIGWCEDFFLVFCDKKDIIKNNKNLRIKNAFFASDKNRNMLIVDSFFYVIRDSISQHYSFSEKLSDVYFKRTYSKYNVSNTRKLYNESVFEKYLLKQNISISSFEEKDIFQKLKILSGVKNAIFIHGASMMNFCFCNNPISIIIINHPEFVSDINWLNQIYLNKKISYKIFDLRYDKNKSVKINLKDFDLFLKSSLMV